MILKVYDPVTDKWFFYDNIGLAKVRHGQVKYPIPPTSEGEISLLAKMEEGSEPFMAAFVDAIFDNAAKTVIFKSGDGYLLNDEGKTIERL